jgi:hypothetical protein
MIRWRWEGEWTRRRSECCLWTLFSLVRCNVKYRNYIITEIVDLIVVKCCAFVVNYLVEPIVSLLLTVGVACNGIRNASSLRFVPLDPPKGPIIWCSSSVVSHFSEEEVWSGAVVWNCYLLLVESSDFVFPGASHVTYFLLLFDECYHQNHHVHYHLGRNLYVHPSDACGWQLFTELLQELPGRWDQQFPS